MVSLRARNPSDNRYPYGRWGEFLGSGEASIEGALATALQPLVPVPFYWQAISSGAQLTGGS